jgi:hypothetical protein
MSSIKTLKIFFKNYFIVFSNKKTFLKNILHFWPENSIFAAGGSSI